MRQLPEFPTWEKSIINTQQFMGLNRGLSIADGEMADMLNMSSDNFPVLSTRSPRGVPEFAYESEITPVFTGQVDGMLGTNRLVVCHDGKVYIDGVAVPLELSTEPSKREKKLVSMGAYVCIWPDKKYFNINDPEDCGDIGIKWEPTEGDKISAMMCRLDGTDYDFNKIVVSDVAPEEPADRELWLDTGGTTHTLMQYSQLYRQWTQVATTYIKIEAPGIGKGIKTGDVVWLTGVHESGAESDGNTGDDIETTTVTETYHGKTVSLTDGVRYKYERNSSKVEFKMTWLTEDAPEKTQTISIVQPAKTRVKSASLKYYAEYSGNDDENYLNATINGYPVVYNRETSIPATILSNNTVSINCKFRVALDGFDRTEGDHYSTVNFSNIRVVVEYEQTHYVGSDYEELERLNTSNRIYGAGDDYIIVAGLLHKVVTLDNTLKLEMKVPDLDYVCEANNRIWGCCYAEQDGTIVNEIRSCALGDYRNWYKFIGTAADSYTVSVGSDGVFTGAYSLQGVPIFYKEAFMHRVGGTIPANFTMNTIRCRGVQNGSWKSLAVVNETLFYKARNEIMAYEGALPYSVSAKLGYADYRNAVAGNYRDKYYINMQDASTLEWHTYVLDVTKGVWHQEDMARISNMATISGELVLAVEGSETTELRTVGNRDKVKEDFPWSVTFGIMGFQSEQQKYLSRYNIRAQMSAGSHMKVEMQYDSDGKWYHMGTMKSPRLQTFLLPIIPRRCDHCQLRISGTGTINIYSVAREYENGGDG